jgi:hypothetical protein
MGTLHNSSAWVLAHSVGAVPKGCEPDLKGWLSVLLSRAATGVARLSKSYRSAKEQSIQQACVFRENAMTLLLAVGSCRSMTVSLAGGSGRARTPCSTLYSKKRSPFSHFDEGHSFRCRITPIRLVSGCQGVTPYPRWPGVPSFHEA